jgi:hypothetical protein
MNMSTAAVVSPRLVHRRTGAGAIGYALVLVIAGVAVIALVSVIGDIVAGPTVAVVVAFASEITVLVVATTHAYPPSVKRPMLGFILLTILFSALAPLVYLSWLWSTGKKWPEESAQ